MLFRSEHLQSIDKVLVNVELAHCTIKVYKSHWYKPSYTIVRYMCGTNGRTPEEAKVIKITEWRKYNNITDIKSFLGIVVYYCIWIPKYAMVSEPLTILLRKNIPFVWEPA